jgi:hypothetical protein
MVLLDAEFNSLSNGASFNRGGSAITKRFPENTRFFKKLFENKSCPDSLSDLR